MTTPPVMSSKRWASNDARFGPRQVTLIDTRRDKALIRYADGRTAWILAHRVHETREQAFIAARRAIVLRYWQRKLRYEQERT